jgi:RNA polymerase sigma factor (sigma-70 family)
MTPRALFHPARLARRPVLSTQSDERLVDLVRAGSDPAFEAIVERYRRALMRYVSRLLPPERAEDVVQQSFVNAYEAIQRDGAQLNLRPWLYRIAHNIALNALRDRALGHAELDEKIDGVERPDQALERAQGVRELLVAVQALPERQRDAILLRELEGRSYEEIAASLGVTGGAVRQLLNRARNSLRAAAAAITPMPLATRVAAGDSTEPVTARMAELVGVGGGALAMKLCATALVTGAVVGGAAVVPDIGREQSGSAPVGAEAARAADDTATGEDADSVADESGEEIGERGRGDGDSEGHSGREAGEREHGGSGRDDDGHRGGDHSGPGGGDVPGDDREERSGSRGGGGDGEDHSGPGGGGDDPDDGLDDHGGPGGGGTEGGELDETADLLEDHSGPGGGGTDSPDSEVPEPDELDSSGSGSFGSGSSGSGSGSGEPAD